MSAGLRSMTGFGRGEATLGSAVVGVEVRCVNSRHLDLRVRLPRDLASLEARARAIAAGHFARGQVEVSVRIARQAAPESLVEIDFDAASRYASAAAELRERFDLPGELAPQALLSLPGVARLVDPELPEDAAAEAVEQALRQACAAAAEIRAREGESLERELRARLERGLERVTQIEARAEEIQRGLRERLEKRLSALAPEIELDAGRLEQEVVLYADRMDVTEETVRWRSHCEQFRETLDSDGPVGRKLEFLLQEMGRETNTIGSKALDAPVARAVVELKTELEKIREQVLNVE